ncbi:large conductance mechanosensitive channel protein MscL [Corynebacterium mucifaciens]|nr:large conductance mechanosensitive channel protein MscL [Corynebacterium mucifaciens]
MLQGFKDFIMRGNVIELAVGVVIGAAFTAVVTAFSDSIINPLLAALGGVDYSDLGLGFHVREGNDATFVNFGALLTAIINFLLIAAVIYFLLVAPMNKLDEATKRRKDIDPEEQAPTDTELLTEIRDLLAAQQQNRPERPLQ